MKDYIQKKEYEFINGKRVLKYIYDIDKRNNKCIHFKSISKNPYEEWKEYDKLNRLIKGRTSLGNAYKYTYLYDTEFISSYKDNNGYSYKNTYDKDYNKIKFEDSDGYVQYLLYDIDNRLIYKHDTNGYTENYEYKDGLLYYNNSDGEMYTIKEKDKI